MKLFQYILLVFLSVNLNCGSAETPEQAANAKPNIIVYFADDISAREFPIYGSSVWASPTGEDTTDPAFRAKTPTMDKMATEGCWIKTAWAATVCSPSRAMMMTGRYAHLHKWWHNGDKGEYIDATGKQTVWPIYESSPLQIGHLAQQAGYGTYWAGKTQMAGDLMRYGFDEGCFTPGMLSDADNPYTDFKLTDAKIDGKKVLVNADTGKVYDTYKQHGWYWYPHVRLMNDPAAPGTFSWWPNTPESKKAFGINTYGPDVELDFVFNFMERQHKQNEPFFIYHTTHLGHGAFNWFFPGAESSWPGTPIVKWDGTTYIRTEPAVTGDKGVYDAHGTITESGIHSHINYIDYQVWRYLEKLKELGVANNTIIIVAADNGTGGYGKASPDRQKGCHVPFLIYAPGFDQKKFGEQDILLNLSDVLPTLADIMGVEIPADYEINGKSFWPWLTTKQERHRDWVYAYRGPMQLIRGSKVMKDGRNKWWDVSETPADLISFTEIKNWGAVSEAHREEREKLMKILPRYDLHSTAHGAPGVTSPSKLSGKAARILKEMKRLEIESARADPASAELR